MANKMLQVECKLGDCMYHQADPVQPDTAFCKHLDKPHYMCAQPCPLYRLDWQKKAAASQNLLRKFQQR
jgi:hypothetical protein